MAREIECVEEAGRLTVVVKSGIKSASRCGNKLGEKKASMMLSWVLFCATGRYSQAFNTAQDLRLKVDIANGPFVDSRLQVIVWRR